MIQRIQTVFLGLISLLMALSTLMIYWYKSIVVEGKVLQQARLGSYEMVMVSFEGGQEKTLQSELTLSILVLSLVASALSAYVIFQYKNRIKQMKLSALNTLFIGGTAAAILFYSFEGEKWLSPESKGTFGWGFYLPALCLGLNTLARHYIVKDEKLVKDSERLR